MAEGARLESVFTRKGNVGSNPTLSANLRVLGAGRELNQLESAGAKARSASQFQFRGNGHEGRC